MKICPRCKKEVDNDLRFCPYCAMKLPPAPREIPWNGNSYYLGDDGRLLTDGTAPDGSRVDSSGIKQ